MDRKHNHNIVPAAKELRKNMTKEERHLWYDFLKGHPARFQRQKILGKYIVDFYCAKANLVIELDGSQHHEERIAAADTTRTKFLENYGLRVLRFPNNEITGNFDGVCDYINAAIAQSLSQPDG